MAGPSGDEGRWRVRRPSSAAESFLADALAGLSATPKSLPPKYFYDERGSQLFERICELPEYYLTRTETALMRSHAAEMARRIGEVPNLIELGSGASTKTRTLIEALRPAVYVPIDISAAALESACKALARRYPALRIEALEADFSADFAWPAALNAGTGARLIYFPGSTIGNFDEAGALALLRRIHALSGREGALLLGVDLKKDKATLEAAYNDSRGITAAFNLNVLARMNRELGADFALDRFEHVAFYDEALGRIEMHLRSRGAQSVRLAGREFFFADAESLHTEISCKYDIADMEALATRAGFSGEAVWTDADRLFGVMLFRGV